MLKQMTLILSLLFIANVFGQGLTGKKNIKEIEVDVVMGIDKVLNLDFVPDARVSVGQPSVLSTTIIPQKKELTLKGVKSGKSSITVRNTVGDIAAKYIVSVTSNDRSKVVAELREFLGGIEGLEIGIMGNSVFVGGQIVVPRDIGRIVTVLEKFPDVMRLVELSPQTQVVIAKKMQEEIQKNGLNNVVVRVINGVFVLEGVADRKGGADLALSIANLYLPDKLQDLASSARNTGLREVRRKPIISLVSENVKEKPKPAPKQIKITTQFVEMSKDYGREFGIKWVPFLSGSGGSIAFGKTTDGGVTTKSNGTLSGVISNLFPKLNSAKQAGYARVVQSGVVLTKNNVGAEIRKQTDINFAVGGGAQVAASPVTTTLGFNLGVTPQILQEENINLKINLGVGIPSGTDNTTNSPLTTNNSIKTEIIVKNLESAVVGGVVQNQQITDYDKHPPGGEDTSENGSPLFRFVRSKKYSTSKSQYVVFVTPQIIENASEGVEKVRRKFRRRSR